MQELSPDEQQHIKKYHKLSPAGKEEVDHYLDFRLFAEAPRVEKGRKYHLRKFQKILTLFFHVKKPYPYIRMDTAVPMEMAVSRWRVMSPCIEADYNCIIPCTASVSNERRFF